MLAQLLRIKEIELNGSKRVITCNEIDKEIALLKVEQANLVTASHQAEIDLNDANNALASTND